MDRFEGTLTFTAGASYDWRNLSRAEEYGTPPGGGANAIFSYPISDADAFNAQGRVEWQASDALAVNASVSSRARFPTIFERFSSRFSGAGFYYKLNDAIVAFQFIFVGQPVSQSRNLGEGNNYGIELSFDMRITPVLSAGGNYAWTEQNLDDPSDAAFRPTGVPTHQAFLWADWRPLERLSLVPSIEIASDRWTVSTDGSRYFRTGSYVDVSLRVDYEITEQVVMGAGIRNAFDSLYYLTDGFPEAGRRFFISLRFGS